MTRLSAPLRKLLQSPETNRRIGPFQLVRQLGRGGSAPVWLSREMYGATELRLAAVKLFSLDADHSGTGGPYSTARTRGRDRIAREARALCQLEHDHVVRFYSIAVDEEAGLLAVAMEYLTGSSLDDALGQGDPLPLAKALEVGAAIASALAAVHGAGLLHCDVKPQNIIFSSGTVKLIDFGIASAEGDDEQDAPVRDVLLDDLPIELNEEEKQLLGARTLDRRSRHSSTYHASGTVGYFDPVCVARREAPTRASDLYALGVVLFECAVGHHPAVLPPEAGGGYRAEILDGREASPSVGDFAPDLPEGFVRLVDSMLSPDPAQRPRSAEWVSIELERIREDVDGRARPLPPEEAGPFRGLGRFEATDRAVYFGRSREIAAALELLRGHGAVTLVGASGSGKSSLARAGIAPRVADGALGRWPADWDIAVMAPGTDAKANLLEALAGMPSPIAVAPEKEPDEVVAALGARAQEIGRGALVVIDQLEELVTSSTAASRRYLGRFIQICGEAPVPGVRLLLAVRSDLLERLLREGPIGTVLVRGSLVVEPMSDGSWGEVVVQALGAYGYDLEDDALHRELVAELSATSGAMPLCAFALTELWTKRDRGSKRISRAALQELGGISGALERHADGAVDRLVAGGQVVEGDVRSLLLSLTTPHGTRASRPLGDVLKEHPSHQRSIAELERARLLVCGEDVTLAHEALLVHWGRLASWLAEARDDRLLADELDREGLRHRSVPDEAPLLGRRRLAMALDLERRGDVAMSDAARAYVAASRRAAARSFWLTVVAAVIGLGLLASAGIGMVHAARQSERAALAKASLEEQKVRDEQLRRAEVEDKQRELDRRQGRIDELLTALSNAPDPSEVTRLREQLEAEQEGARNAQASIHTLAATPAGPGASASPSQPSPEGPISPQVPTLKVQREDDE